MNLSQFLQNKLIPVLTGMTRDAAKYAAQVKLAQDPKHADYQANCSMGLAKELGRPAREVAEEIAAKIDLGEQLERPEVAGPGFINLRFKPEWLGRQIQLMATEPKFGVSPPSPTNTYVIDFSSPNVAKPLHVGHLRSTIIGDALSRLLRYLGHRVVTDNHLGDWGTQFGMLLYGYKQFRDEAALKADPVKEMLRIYLKVRELTKAKEDDDDPEATGDAAVHVQRCRDETAKLHAGDAENTALWKQFMPWCMDEIHQIYRRLGIQHDVTLGESFYNPMLPDVVDDLLAKGIARETEGAVGVFVGDDPDAPPALIRKRDGAFTYMTTDLATIRYRISQWNADEILYVVDTRQKFHFDQLFAIARICGFDKVKLAHVNFGTVLDAATRKPIKTREGGAVTLGRLLDESLVEAERVYERTRTERIKANQDVPELAPDQRAAVIEAVGYGAVKYSDMSQNRESDYVFDWKKMLATDGNTATYMQYAYARSRSIFRKESIDTEPYRQSPPLVVLEHPNERSLALQLLRFEEALLMAAADYKPNMITAYLWDLAKSYSGFFVNCPVLRAETAELRNSRLLLCDLTARVIQQSLHLLGIQTVEQM
jgi:arginyl-tRNA synthetase